MIIAGLVAENLDVFLLVIPLSCSYEIRFEFALHADTGWPKVIVELDVFFQVQQTNIVKQSALVVVLVQNPLLYSNKERFSIL